MRSIIIINLRLVCISLFFVSCSKSLLDKVPQDRVTNLNFWITDDNFRSYALGLYNFYGYGVGNVLFGGLAFNSDETCATQMYQNSRIYDRDIVPNTGGAWNWTYLRSVNILITQARNSKLPMKDKQHWEAVGRFFRAGEYFSKVKSFGNVPWIGHELSNTDSALFKAQDSRTLVMDSVLADLNFAIQFLRETDQPNQIVRAVALALKSRICLFEGTFRKYHTELNLQSTADTWFTEVAAASESLITGNKYQLNADYRSIYSSIDLAGNLETILYKQYENGVIGNVRTRAIGQGPSGTPSLDATRDAIVSYLCDDGLPYGVSPTHPLAQNGEPETIEDEFQHRDLRLGKTFVIPYVNSMPNQNPALISTTHFIFPEFMPCYIGEGGIPSATGYHPYKWWNPDSPYDNVNNGTLDAAIFALNEVLLNYAEAKAELNQCTQDVLDISINRLRDRVSMPHLTLQGAAAINDPRHQKFAPDISNLLWEIRRERQVELMWDGTRIDDIKRWKKASYLSKPIVGSYVDLANRPASAYNSDGTPKATIILGNENGEVMEGATRGYVLPYGDDHPPFHSDDDMKMYYDPIATQELLLNKKLIQSPGW
ncbi:MAG: RagB/SusD family nutrient uptake outer membrane protein [Chitinophagaceae bacterium]|nr:RagB/SusD family nutrient uptake outer membrane protein [Chitinophagaceae bacterium]